MSSLPARESRTSAQLVPERARGDRVALPPEHDGAELFCVALEGDSRLYFAPLLGKTVVVSNVTGDPWAPDSDSPTLERLRERGMLTSVPDSRDASDVAGPPADPLGAILLLTDRCNLDCTYCYGRPVRTAARRMSWHVAKSVADCVTANALRAGATCHIAFHGSGEPTFEIALIKQMVEYVSERMADGEGAEFSMVSNGTCSEDVAHWMGQNMASIQISLDGPKELHEVQRPMSGGGESWGKTVRTLTILQEYDVQVLVKSTITDWSASRLEEITAFLSQATSLQRFHFGLVVPVPGVDPRWTAPDAQVFLAHLKAARTIAESAGSKIVVSAAEEAFPDVRRRYCGVTMPNLAVTPEGAFTACYQVASEDDPRWDVYQYGRVEDDGSCTFDQDKRTQISRMSPRTSGLCADCFCRWQCDGDCLARLSGTTVDAYDVRCRVNRALVLDLLLRGQVKA